jgi:predicted amidohydrolase
MISKLKLATVQCAAVQGNIDKTVDHICKTLRWADSNNIDIICFPECYLQGYYHDKESIRKHAISLSSNTFINALNRLKQFNTTIILGLIEEKENRIYNTAIVIERGQVIGSYNKIHLNETKYTAGTTWPVFNKNGIIYGIHICNDSNHPESVAKLKAKGAEIIFFPLNNLLPIKIADEWKEKSQEVLANRAKENNCWIVSSDIVCEGIRQKSYGCTMIVSPAGEIIKRVTEFKEGSIST